MRAARLLLPLVLFATLALPALAWKESLETPWGLATVEGDAAAGEPLRLLVGGREIQSLEGWVEIWPEAVAGNWLLVALVEGGTICAVQWMWVPLGPGEPSKVFGTCGMVEAAREEPDGSLSARLHSYDPDFPISYFTYDTEMVREFPQPQEPAAVPLGAPGEAWVGRYPYEPFMASDWRGPLIALLGEEGYDEAQAAFGQVRAFEVEGDWAVARGCVMHACGMLEGRIAIHRTNGRVLVALAEEGELPRLWGEEPGEMLPPTIAELMVEF